MGGDTFLSAGKAHLDFWIQVWISKRKINKDVLDQTKEALDIGTSLQT